MNTYKFEYSEYVSISIQAPNYQDALNQLEDLVSNPDGWLFFV